MQRSNAGNVGIGTVGAPTEKLQVNGKIKAQSFMLNTGEELRNTWEGITFYEGCWKLGLIGAISTGYDPNCGDPNPLFDVNRLKVKLAPKGLQPLYVSSIQFQDGSIQSSAGGGNSGFPNLAAGVNNNIWIRDQYALQFGPRVGLPDGNAASIKLGISGTDEYLNIFGGTGNGKAYPARKVQIYTEAGGLIVGKMKIQDPWSPIVTGHTNALLDVYGSIYSTKTVVTQIGWADDEFDAQSPSLEQEQATATKEKHLIGVPKECELNETGLDLGKMQEIQMRKIEQLYKHLWKMNKRMEQLEKENLLLKSK